MKSDGLPEWVVAYAEYEGRAVVLVDRSLANAPCRCGLPGVSGRWAVGRSWDRVGPDTPRHWARCPRRAAFAALPQFADAPAYCHTDDEDEARAVFAQEAQRVRVKA